MKLEYPVSSSPLKGCEFPSVSIERILIMKKNRIFSLLMLLMTVLLAGCSSEQKAVMTDEPVIAETPTDIKTVACIGDSITYGAGVSSRAETYPAYLQLLLGEGYSVKNYGLNGRTLLKDADFPYTEESYYTESLELKADIYIIMLGSNDSRPSCWNEENYRTELREFVESYQAVSDDTKVYLMQPPKCFAPSGYGISDDVISTEIYEAVKDVAKETGAGLIDLYSFTKDHSEWFPDSVHPNAEGNEAIAGYIFECMNIAD